MSESTVIEKLKRTANECRLDIITMLEKAKSGHPGGSLSVIDILTCLYCHEMKVYPNDPMNEDRDRLILSKGHGVPALYAVLAKLGILERDELWTLRQIGSRLQGHPDRVKLPIVEASTGSLGQGLSIAQGMAMALKMNQSPRRVFCVMGDGEIQEGQVWETAMSAPKFKLNNLICFVDCNNGQIDGHVTEVMDLSPLPDKWRAFNWAVHEIDGHNVEEILSALEKSKKETTKPTMILAKTVKGKGVSFMENQISWHGIGPSAEEADKARAEIQKTLDSLG
ncbi:MAG: transketolase [Bdellovibrionales bacterium]|nr:transketolase [Bdellovibrionales bacterium]